jgi:3-deoxy-D-manno-octulosonate 8-phosphate phosphatase (KDO 8-P phosphatase)
LGIRHVAQGTSDKLAALRKLAKARGLAFEDCVCVGDDTPDAPILAAAGLGIAVADAHQDALDAADLVTARRGGHGAVREVCDWLIGAQGFP